VSVRVHLHLSGPGRLGADQSLDVSGRHIIGRDAKLAEIALPHDSKLSARHCAIELEKGVVIIRDLQSRNGTLVNGVQIQPIHRLEEGDVIRAGDTEIKVSFAGVARGVRA
jgi:pSer/pThr/pTyr-binding forkhead associated (FHA) protein